MNSRGEIRWEGESPDGLVLEGGELTIGVWSDAPLSPDCLEQLFGITLSRRSRFVRRFVQLLNRVLPIR